MRGAKRRERLSEVVENRREVVEVVNRRGRKPGWVPEVVEVENRRGRRRGADMVGIGR